jgi:hypothetical protein
MTPANLREEIAIELEAMEKVVNELLALQHDVAQKTPTIREKTAGAAFLAQFYNGLENILKRISLYNDIPLPTGPNWHVDLFQQFTTGHAKLPRLFDEKLATSLAPYRRFRHVAFHSYGFGLEWNRMVGGIEEIEVVFDQFRSKLADYLESVK